MLSADTVEQAQKFSQWKRDDTIDNTIKCPKCEKYYDYRIYMVHTCSPAKESLGFIPSV